MFEVEERPPEDKFTQKLSRYTKLVYSDAYDEGEALELRKELSQHFGPGYQDLVKLDLYIENRNWEKEYEKNS